MGAVGAAVSVVSGIAGISQQNKAAQAQKTALASAQEQQALQAQLNYLSLKQQTYADQLNDYITDATRKLQYQQSQSQLSAQKQMNDLAVANANFEANLAKSSADLQQMASDNQATRQQSEADNQARQQALATQGQATQEQDAQIQSLLKALGEGSNQQATVANLMDTIAARGGVNEALSLLLNSNALDAIRAGANIQRGEEVQGQRIQNAQALASSTTALNASDAAVSQGMSAVQATQTKYGADNQIQDANFSQQLANQGFASTQAANDASYSIGLLSDTSNRYSRDYLRQVNQDAILKGAQLQSNVLKAQASAVQTPGFFDYLGVGFNAYNTYNALQPKPTPTIQYANK